MAVKFTEEEMEEMREGQILTLPDPETDFWYRCWIDWKGQLHLRKLTGPGTIENGDADGEGGSFSP